jgi:transposase-like protein
MMRKKHDASEKINAVKKYKAGESSQKEIAEKMGITKTSFQQWVRNYESMGEAAFLARGNKKYTPELKTMAVKEYLAGKGSQSEICKKYGIRSKLKLQKWIKQYNGYEDFKQPNSGGEIYMTKGRATAQEERVEIVSHCIANNKDYGKTIEQYGVSYQQIYGWVKKYEDKGIEGLRIGEASRRKPKR